MRKLTDAMWCAWNSHNFGQTFRIRIHEEMRDPALHELWEGIVDRCARIHDHAHAVNYLNGRIDWENIHASPRSGVGDMLRMTVERVKETDVELLALVRRAIGVLNKE